MTDISRPTVSSSMPFALHTRSDLVRASRGSLRSVMPSSLRRKPVCVKDYMEPVTLLVEAMLPILQPKLAGVRDPVCGMLVDPQQAAGSAVYQGETYYFCSKGCAAKFQADPEKYLHPNAAPEPMQPEAPGVEYTCPMHPEVRQIGPGSCPICGMALEPVHITRDSA